MPHNAVIQEELPAIDFPMDKGAVLPVREEQRPSSLPVYDLFHEIYHQSIEALVTEGKDRVQGSVRQKHIVCVTEHDVIRSCKVIQTAPGSGQPRVIELHIPDGIRKAAEELL